MSATTEFSETPFQSFRLLVSGDIWGENPARAQRFSIGNLKDEASGQAFRRQPSHHRSAACHRPFAAMGRNAGAHSATISKHPTVRVLPLNKGGPQRQGRPPGWPSRKPRSKAHQNPRLPVAREHLTSRPHLPAAPVTNARVTDVPLGRKSPAPEQRGSQRSGPRDTWHFSQRQLAGSGPGFPVCRRCSSVALHGRQKMTFSQGGACAR